MAQVIVARILGKKQVQCKKADTAKQSTLSVPRQETTETSRSPLQSRGTLPTPQNSSKSGISNATFTPR